MMGRAVVLLLAAESPRLSPKLSDDHARSGFPMSKVTYRSLESVVSLRLSHDETPRAVENLLGRTLRLRLRRQTPRMVYLLGETWSVIETSHVECLPFLTLTQKATVPPMVTL